MGQCLSSSNSSSGNGIVDDEQKKNSSGKISNRSTETLHVGNPMPPTLERIESIPRVGSKVLKAVTTRGDSEETRTRLEPSRASTYEHVNQIVEMNLNDNNNNSSSSDVFVVTDSAGVVGLRNLGNTCFMNASLQCLSNTIPLTDYFLGYDYRSEINTLNFLGTEGRLVRAYATLIKQIWLPHHHHGTEREPLDLHSFKTELERFAPQFKDDGQHDAQELLTFLLDGIHEDVNRVICRPDNLVDRDCDGTNDAGDAMLAWQNYLQRNKSIVVDLFQGQLRNTMTCRNRHVERKEFADSDGSVTVNFGCGYTNIRFDPFMYLSIPIPNDDDDDTRLDDCMDLFCAEEQLTGDDGWYCPKCRRNVDATKKLDIWMLPPILIIHLKRFRVTAAGSVRSKITTELRYPIEHWDLSHMVKNRVKGSFYGTTTKRRHKRRHKQRDNNNNNSSSGASLYDLYAVCHHHGELGHGHYTAHAKNRVNDTWVEFNDSVCRPIADGMLETKDAYCLFYNRVGRKKNHPPKVFRQSIRSPEHWPHMQVMTTPNDTADTSNPFRSFRRSSIP